MLANVGIPKIVVQWPLMVAVLVPLIILEALLIVRWLSLSYRDAFICIGNKFTTGINVGHPLCSFCFLVVAPASTQADLKTKKNFRRGVFHA
jgi:hypothetical protein